MDVEREEGEMSDDTEMLVDVRPISKNENECTVLYRADKSGLLVKKLEKVDAAKLDERAKRFGLNLCGNRIVTQKQIDELYSNCGIESGNERHFRFDALHLNGVDGLSTKEIFEYLEDYKPVSLEWIDDNSCNVVCKDHISAALALLVHSREIQNKHLKDINEQSLHHWREGMPHSKKDTILMRFATNSDKKISKKTKQEHLNYGDRKIITDSDTKNPWGDLCKSWGVYDHQEIFQRKLPKNEFEDESEGTNEVQIKNKKLAMRLGKRSHNNINHEDSNSDSEWKKKSKAPRMRMHADDEESKKKKSYNVESSEAGDGDAFAPLSIEVVNTKISFTPRNSSILSEKFRCHGKEKESDTRGEAVVPDRSTAHSKSHKHTGKHDVHSRLGAKVISREEYSSTDDSSSDNSDYNEQIMSRVQKVDNNISKSSVWSRLEEKQQDQRDHRDLRLILKNRQKNTDDLRGRLGKPKQSNLRIEIDNDVVSE